METDRTVKTLLAVITLIAVMAALQVGQPVILLLLIAWLLSHGLSPAVDFLAHRLRFPHFLAVLTVLVFFLGMFFLVGLSVNTRVATFAAAYPEYHKRLTEIFASLTERLHVLSLPFSHQEMGNRFGQYLVSLSGSFLAFLSGLVLVFFFLVFMLLGRPHFQWKLHGMLQPATADKLNRINNAISRQIGRYLLLQVLINLVLAVCVWFSLALLKVDFAVTWGMLAFFLNFIPTLGAILASVPPILVALIQYYPHPWTALTCLLVLLGVNCAFGYIVIPKVMGNRFDLSPVVVLLFLVFWGWLWGVVGAFLSILIAVALKIVCENVDPLKPLAVLMGAGHKTSEAAPQTAER